MDADRPTDERRPGDPLDVDDVIDGPHLDPVAGYLASFAALDPALPLALLPVRIETRFVGDPTPSELLVRIFPDVIHADGHATGLTAHELDLARSYWRRTWRAGDDRTAADQAFAWLADHVGPWRAAWVARAMTPRNQDRAPTAPLPDGVPLDPRPRFPDLEPDASGRPVYARLLPRRWVVVAVVDNEEVGRWVGAAIPEELALAPGLVDTAGAAPASRRFLDAQGLGWTHDPEAAEAVGMLVRIDLDVLGVRRFDELIVVGIDAGLGPADLDALLAAHRYTQGLDLVPQGTATNATATVVEPWHPGRPDPAVVWASEQQPAPGGPRPALDSEGDLLRLPGAEALRIALGLGPQSPLDRSPHADVAELPQAEAMNRVVWPATLGHYLASPLAGVVSADGQAWLRDWATSFVRGGGPLPTLLVGAQPYGVVPVSSIDVEPGPSTNIQRVEQAIDALGRSHWNEAVTAVPRIDPNAADSNADAPGLLAATVAQVLGTVPHPTALRLRHVDAMRDEYNAQFGGDLLGLGLTALTFFDGDGTVYGDDPANNYAQAEYQALVDDLDDAQSPEGQLNDLEHHRDNLQGASAFGGTDLTDDQLAFLDAMAARITDDMIPLVAAHIDRVRPVRNAINLAADPGQVDASQMIGDDDDPQLFFAMYAGAGGEQTWNSPLVAAGSSADDVAALDSFLRDARDRVADGLPLDDGFGTDRPLLHHLVSRSAGRVATDADRELLVAGLDGLLAIAAGDPTPVSTLERLLQESLGVASYRLDAWYTGVAAWRLENKRARRPQGLHVGAYGFVVDLRRRPTRPSQGHVLAPSLSLATTAAVLRSGWAALGGDSQTSGLAVDLSSDRIRRAHWLADGVRRGQDLAELLGARFERRLHDVALDRWVRPFRELALAAVGETAPPNAIVDGLLLARAHGGGVSLSADEAALAADLPGWLASPDRPPGDPAGVLDDLLADLDAVADAAVAQTVFALVEGNTAEAAATLSAATTGEVELPALRVADTPRPATTIAHRLAVLVDPAAAPAWPGADRSGRALAAPAVEAWVEDLLGPPEAITFDVVVSKPSGAQVRRERTNIAAVGLGALDLAMLTPAGGAAGLGRLGETLSAWARSRLGPGDEDASVAIATEGTLLADVVVVARSVRSLVAAANDLDATAFAEPGAVGVAAGVDAGELADRVDAVATALAAGRSALGAAAAAVEADGVAPVWAAIAALAGFELPGGATGADEASAMERARRLLAILDRRLSAHVAATSAATAGPPPSVARTGDRLAALVGQRLAWAPRFSVADPSALEANVARRRVRAGDVPAWLAAAGRVDDGAERLRVAVDLVEALAARLPLEWHVAQFPDMPTEGWAATASPAFDGRGRVCVTAAGPAPDPAGPMAGLLISSWTDAIPTGDQLAGVALHFDAPSARAPQAVLLCVAEPANGFSVDAVVAMVRQTLRVAMWRMVGLETLAGLGQYVPAIYLPDGLEPGVQR